MRNALARYWRPVGCWLLTLNAGFGFPVILVGIFMFPGVDWGTASGTYATVLATWAAAAGIRQWGKSNGSETED